VTVAILQAVESGKGGSTSDAGSAAAACYRRQVDAEKWRYFQIVLDPTAINKPHQHGYTRIGKPNERESASKIEYSTRLIGPSEKEQ
jgi:hypothetical protein